MTTAEQPSRPVPRSAIRHLGTLLIVLLWVACIAFAALVVLILVDTWVGVRPPDTHVFRRTGESYVTQGDLPLQTFPARREPGTLRVFVLGASQAMGYPYVVRQELLTTRLITPLNKGGLATWLEAYLQRAFPDRKVQVVNAAQPASEITDAARVLEQLASLDVADVAVVLSGDNERTDPRIVNMQLAPGASLSDTVAALDQRYRAAVGKIEALSAAHRLPTYLLTVPDNLDWGGAKEAVHLVSDEELAGLAARTLSEPQNGEAWFALGQAERTRGEREAAWEHLQRAKDLDPRFMRARSSWNSIIREAGGPWLRPMDLERLLAAHSTDGVPGFDLFHDYCHFRLNGNRIVGWEVARRLIADLDSTARIPVLDEVPLGLVPRDEVKWLYRLKLLQWVRRLYFAGLPGSSSADVRRVADTFSAEVGSVSDSASMGAPWHEPAPKEHP